MNIWVKRCMLATAGGMAGFAYYYFIGCASGACPVTSNPYISTVYGALIGSVLGAANQQKKQPW